MIMQILHYDGRRNKLLKGGFISGKVATVKLKDRTNYIDPVVELTKGRISMTDQFGDDITGNYCYLKWDYAVPVPSATYYFIEKTEVTPNDVIRLYLHIDVLQTYVEDIRKSFLNGDYIITRSGAINSANGQPFEDYNVSVGARGPENQTVIRFANLFSWDNPYFLLTVAGSYGIISET